MKKSFCLGSLCNSFYWQLPFPDFPSLKNYPSHPAFFSNHSQATELQYADCQERLGMVNSNHMASTLKILNSLLHFPSLLPYELPSQSWLNPSFESLTLFLLFALELIAIIPQNQCSSQCQEDFATSSLIISKYIRIDCILLIHSSALLSFYCLRELFLHTKVKVLQKNVICPNKPLNPSD